MKIVLGIKRIFFGTYARGFVSSYLLFMVVGALLLRLPIALQAGESISMVDALFISASGLSTTGLSTVSVRDTFTVFGQTVLVFIIQFGGIGLIMMVALFWLVAKQKINFKQRNMIMTDQNQLSRQGVVRFVRNVLFVIFFIEVVAFIIMASYLTLRGYFPLGEAVYHAFFTTISLFVNAGFDISPGNDSFMLYRNDYFMQTLAMSLMFLGAVGFWPLVEVKEWIASKIKGESFKFSIFAKLLVSLHLIIWLISATVLYTLEYDNFFSQQAGFEGIYYALFMSLTTRNAGFSTMEVTLFSPTTHVFMMLLMFVGSSPNSAGGGIRTTTLFLALLGVRAFARGDEKVVMRERTVKHETVHKSLIVIVVALIFVFFQVMLISFFEPYTPNAIAFEVISAFGTTGLSLGITESLMWPSKVILIVTMFVGRVGILALLLMFKPGKRESGNLDYPEIDIIVG